MIPEADRRPRLLLALGFAAALAVRLGFFFAFHDNYDMQSWKTVSRTILAGGNVYLETTRYNYSPLWAYLVGGVAAACRAVGAPLSVGLLAVLLAADALTASLVYRLARELGRSPGLAGGAALLFFANPVSVFGSTYFVQFDALAVAFLLLAVLAAVRRPPRPIAATASLALSLLVKHVAWFHPLSFSWRRESRVRGWPVSLVAYLIFAASFAPFWQARRAILAQVLGYRGMDEPYALEPLMLRLGFPAWVLTAVFVTVGLAAAVATARLEPVRGSLVLFLATLLVLPGVSPYYFVWPIALGSVLGGLGYLVYTVVITGFFVHSPDGLGVEIAHLPGWAAVWWATALYLLWELRAAAVTRDRS
jgi:hypothetical protein